MTHDPTHDAEMAAIVAELEAAASRRMTAQDGPYPVRSRR